METTGCGTVLAALDCHLDPTSRDPVALALSGGGDSIALLRLTAAWAQANGRRLLALTVDHGLSSDSAAWTAFAGREAQALGCDWRALAWTGPKPATGLPAAARAARHALLADAAREAGACVILMGHTADDVLEGEIMRAGDAPTLGRLRAWSPSPAWPEGRGVFLARPLLQVRRAALRAWLTEQGADWLEDPANDDVRFARARARARLHLRGPGTPVFRQAQDEGSCCASGNDTAVRTEPATLIQSRPHPELVEGRGRSGACSGAVRLAPRPSASLLSAATLCAAGTARPPRAKAVACLQRRLFTGGRFTATLAGARIDAQTDSLLITREPGERGRGGLAALDLLEHRPIVWDGRFELTAHAPGLTVVPLAGHAARLSRAERATLSALPPAARAGLPALLHPTGAVSLPARFGDGPATARCLVHDRFDAALGLIPDERTLAARNRAARSHGAGEALTLS